MRIRLILCLTSISAFIATGSANAELIGDRDWLQITQTTGYSWNEMDAIFDTSTGQCDVASCVLGGSVNLAGYTWASASEVNDLFISQFGTGLSNLTSDNTVGVGVDGVEDFIPHRFSPTFFSGDTLQEIYGRTRDYDDVGNLNYFLGATSWIGTADAREDIIWLRTSTTFDVGNRIIGGWFYRSVAVPEPGTLALFGIGLAGMGLARRRKKA